MATVQIRPATVADAGALAKIHADAYGSIQDFYTAMFKRSLPDLLPDLTAFALERGHSQFLVATDPSSGQPVGFIRWDIEDPSQPPPSVEDVPNRPKIEPKEHLKEVYSRFRDARDEEQDAQYEEASAEQKHACRLTHCKDMVLLPSQLTWGLSSCETSHDRPESSEERHWGAIDEGDACEDRCRGYPGLPIFGT